MKVRRVSITTIDNPFDPIEDFDHWFQFDVEKGYYTCNKLARLYEEFDGMTQIEEDFAVENAIDRLIQLDPLDIYKKVVKEVEINDENDEKTSEINKIRPVDVDL